MTMQMELLRRIDDLEAALDGDDGTDLSKFAGLCEMCHEFVTKHEVPVRKYKLAGISWVTTTNYREAAMYTDDNEDELVDLPQAELMTRVQDTDDDWYLLHPDAGLFPDSSPIPRYAKLSGTATLEKVLLAIEDMTISFGENAIHDHVYFEGIQQLTDDVWVVVTGS